MSTEAQSVAGAEQESTAGRAAGEIRARIIAGHLRPGQRLTEEHLRREIGVSRSTLREALRSLAQNRLVIHHLARGFFVRELTRADLVDIYATRRVIECSAVKRITRLSMQQLRRLSEAVRRGRSASEAQSWQEAAAASIGFHEVIVDLAGSPRLSEMNSRVLAEFRLSYQYMEDPFAFHVPFIARNEEIADLIRQGRTADAASALESYLDDSEATLLSRLSGIMGPA